MPLIFAANCIHAGATTVYTAYQRLFFHIILAGIFLPQVCSPPPAPAPPFLGFGLDVNVYARCGVRERMGGPRRTSNLCDSVRRLDRTHAYHILLTNNTNGVYRSQA